MYPNLQPLLSSQVFFQELKALIQPMVITSIPQGSFKHHNVFLKALHTEVQSWVVCYVYCWQKILIFACPISHHCFQGGKSLLETAQVCESVVEVGILQETSTEHK